MKRIGITIAAIAMACSVEAYDFEADGIYYNITSEEARTCEVTYKTLDETTYTGDVTIPGTVLFGNVEYRVTRIGCNAFADYEQPRPTLCKSLGNDGEYLMSVTLPEGLIEIGDRAFAESTLTQIEIPSTVTAIGKESFYCCWMLQNVTLPKDTELSIGDRAFRACYCLQEISIPQNATLGEEVFKLCDNGLKMAEFAEGFAGAIPAWTFSGCVLLENVNIPAGITAIGEYAFEHCMMLKEINIAVTEPLTIDAKVFYGMQLGNVKLTVPAGSKSLYELADVWKDFGNITESSTGIALTGADECKASDEMFDLSGAAIETRPENGIFIQGRKKMMITK